MLSEATITLLFQLPLVGIFVIFILEWSKRLDKSQFERDEKWREFLKEERLFRNELLSAMSHEIRDNTNTLTYIAESIAKHEVEARSRTRRLTDKVNASEKRE
jgi:K+-sensing histidine kinase KdpD